MKVILGKHNNVTVAPAAVMLDLSQERPPPFTGFSYTVEEGLRLAARCFTDIPGLAGEEKPRRAGLENKELSQT